jgi:hypothetical protein
MINKKEIIKKKKERGLTIVVADVDVCGLVVVVVVVEVVVIECGSGVKVCGDVETSTWLVFGLAVLWSWLGLPVWSGHDRGHGRGRAIEVLVDK